MYQLPILHYSFEELEPFIDTHTLALHYHKHEQNYLNQLNNLLQKNNYDYRYSLSELYYHINEFQEEDRENIRFNLGGVLNHNLYWKSMNPLPNRPQGKLKIAIEKEYTNYDNFWKEFKKKALSLKGSGYTFLVLTNNNDLDIINMQNQENPLSLGLMPLFNIDLWEHAYYLNYKNEKENYIDNFEKIADFTNANVILNSIK